MYIMDSLLLEMGLVSPDKDDAFADGASLFEDGASEAEVRAYLAECFGDALKNMEF